jgi:hypothetical protein
MHSDPDGLAAGGCVLARARDVRSLSQTVQAMLDTAIAIAVAADELGLRHDRRLRPAA